MRYSADCCCIRAKVTTLQRVLGLPRGLFPVGHARNTSRGRRPGGHPIQIPEPPQLALLDVEEQRLYSELLLGDRAPHHISKGAPRHPAEETHFGRLYPGSRSFGHDPKFMTIGDCRNVNWTVNQELRLSAQLSLHHYRPIQWPHYFGRCTDPPVSLTLHPSLTREQDPKILRLLHLRQKLSPNLEGASHLMYHMSSYVNVSFTFDTWVHLISDFYSDSICVSDFHLYQISISTSLVSAKWLVGIFFFFF